MRHAVRIIGGRYKGKLLQVIDAEALRPTPNRVKETLFNWLMPVIQGARCLDAFAGSGSLGFEAHSRGATEVVLLDNSSTVCKSLQAVANHFSAESLSIVQSNALQYFQQSKKVFDVIFLDPPFASDLLASCLEALASSALLAKDGLIYIESASPLVVDETSYTLLKSKKAGQVYYGLLQKNA